jgi:nitrogen fixation protein FixH
MAMAGEARHLSGRAVFGILIAGFAVVLIVNAAMIWLALDSAPGLVSDTPYQDGLAYNRVLEDGEKQAELGWQVSVTTSAGTIEVAFDDREGRPVSGLLVSGNIRRPTNDESDHALDWVERVPGRYESSSPVPSPGVWDVVIEASKSGSHYRAESRIFVQP